LLPDGRWLIVGGEGNGGPQATIAIKDSASRRVTALRDGLQQPRAWHTATLLPDGNVLVYGGIGANGRVTSSAELFDPQTEKSEQIPSLGLAPRAGHTATLLTDGRVLIAGGVGDNGRTVSAANLWDTQANTGVTLPSELRGRRHRHTAAILPDGNVLLWGGQDGDGNRLDGGEIYDAEKQSFSWASGAFDSQDASAPYLVDSLPKGGEAGVWAGARLALRFSKPLRVDAVGTETVVLYGPQGKVAAKAVPVEAGMLVFIKPDAPLSAWTSYTLALSSLTDVSGLPLPPTTVTFTTGGAITRPEESAPSPTPIHTTAAHDHMAHDHMRHSDQSLAPGNLPPDEEEWRPDASNFQGEWKSRLPDSKAQTLELPRAGAGVTALAGRVLTLKGRGLPNVTIVAGGKSTVTDGAGRFLLADIPPGRQALIINGTTASSLNKPFAMFDTVVELKKGETNVLPFTVWLPIIERRHGSRLEAPTPRSVVATTPLIPGLEIHVPAGVVFRYPSGGVFDNLTITPIPVDRAPLPGPPGLVPRMLFTLQMHGAKATRVNGLKSPGLRIVYPNYGGLPPGTRVPLWNYDSMGVGWHVYGHGRVTKNGRQVVPDAGVELPSMHCYGGFFDTGAPPEGPPPCGGCPVADPVDLSTGLFIYGKTDLALSDILPVSVTRNYRPNDYAERPFGIGTTHPYEMMLIGDNGSLSPMSAELVLPDGGRVKYERVGTGSPITLEHTATPSRFYKSILTDPGESYGGDHGGWALKLQDGTVYQFAKWTRGMWIHSAVVKLVGIVDRYGNKITITRDGAHRASRVTSPNGRWIEFTYDTEPTHENRIIQTRDNIGRTVGYTYDAGGRLWKVTDPSGGVTEYTYDASHRMTTVKDARGIVFLTNEYDGGGKVMKQTLADGKTYQFAYTLDANNKIVQADVTDQRGHTRRVTFNASGYLLTDTRALSKTEQQTVTYERQAGTNKVLSVINPLGRKTTYTYYPAGGVQSITRLSDTAAAATANFTYDPTFNQLSSVTDSLNHTTSFGYDVKGNLISVTDPLNHQTTYGYNTAGQLTSSTDALQHTTQLIYETGDLVEVRDPLGRVIRNFVDGAGRVVRVTNPLGHTTRYEYDALNQVKKVTDALQGVTEFAYDPNGNLLSVKDARGNVTGYTYNNMDRVETRTDPLSRLEQYEYDEAGNLTKSTDRRGKVTTYLYDALNRMTFAGYGTVVMGENTIYESIASYDYDGANRLTQAVDSLSGTITRGYDDVAGTLSETTVQGVVSYSYDGAGRVTGKTITGQAAISYGYDNASRLTGITQGAASVSFGYDEANRRTSLTLPNGAVVEYGYDDASQLIALTYKQGATMLGDLTYEHDLAGRRVKVGGSYARTNLPQALISASYDDANQLTQRGATAVTYDSNGNLTSDGMNTYTWDARNQLTSINGGLTASFQYDAFGRRIGKTVNGQTTSYLYDGANVVRELQGTIPLADLLSGGVDEVFSRADGAGARSFLTDGLGSTVALLDGAGATQASYTYEPFGATTINGVAGGNSTAYTGREDDGTGLYYYRARYYSPTLQRFVSEDPTGFTGGDVNFYAYVFNSPANYTDPSGLSAWKKLVKIFTQSGEHVASFSKPLSKDKKLDKIKEGLEEARRRGNHPGPIIQTEDPSSAKTIAEALSPDGKARGPERSPGYPEHYNPNSGDHSGAHVQWDPPIRASAIGAIAAIFAPHSMMLSGRKGTTDMQMASAGFWDIASTIDPIFITDGLEAYFGFSPDECQ